jgi:hypothetical protein
VASQPLLVGFHGVKRSGKDTAASFLEVWASGRSLSFARRGFADKAKLAFARQFYPSISMKDAIVWCDTYKDTEARVVVEVPTSPSVHHAEVQFRQCLAQFATQGARHIYGEDHWVDQLLPLDRATVHATVPSWHDNFKLGVAGIDNPILVADVCAIIDMRFDNEIERIRRLGGINVKIRRAVAEDAVLAQDDIHESEMGIPDQEFDYVVPNNGTLEDLQVLINSLAETLITEQFQGAGRESR